VSETQSLPRVRRTADEHPLNSKRPRYGTPRRSLHSELRIVTFFDSRARSYARTNVFDS